MNDDTIGDTSTPEPVTDWQRVRSMTDAEVHARLANDPDVVPTDQQFWETARVASPRRKQLVTIRIDAHVLAWFRRERGYQTKINANLRAYMSAKRRA